MLTDCPQCWDSPCTCGYAYWFMPLERVAEIAAAARKVLGDRRGNRRPPAAVREELERRARNAEAVKRMTSEDWYRSIEIPAAELARHMTLDTSVPHAALDAFALRRGGQLLTAAAPGAEQQTEPRRRDQE